MSKKRSQKRQNRNKGAYSKDANQKSWQVTAISIAVLSLVSFVFWIYHEPGYEPLIGLMPASLVVLSRYRLKFTWKQKLLDIFAASFLVAICIFVIITIQKNVPKSSEKVNNNALVGMLESSYFELLDAVRGFQISLGNAKVGMPQSIAPKVPDTLSPLKKDGNLYVKLSKSFKKEIPQFIKQLQTFNEGYLNIATYNENNPQPGTIHLMLLECYTQLIAVYLERKYQNKILSAEVHEKRFDAILNFKASNILTGGHWSFSKFLNNVTQIEDENLLGYFSFRIGLLLSKLDKEPILKIPVSPICENEINELGNKFISLGLPLDVKPIVDRLKKNPEKFEQIVAMIYKGIYAIQGKKGAATFLLGVNLEPVLGGFIAYLTDDKSREIIRSKIKNIYYLGIPINSNINDFILPDTLKKEWVNIYAIFISGRAYDVEYITKWKEEILNNYL